ncbi:hypothetical protein QRE62_10365 [Bacillus mycoides]|uniref:hypothetical protein n=1 Tax=Bacillus mycoides TaxID=1405 RepID=UPI0025707985|nr:hypothetical protein [Bacillus mycoides]WJE77995.1 hypothetical protein QRE62_10365 [Bacillus mycoides]
MKNLFNGFFKKGNETKLEKLQGEQAKLQGQISQLQAKQVKFQNALQLAEVDHELDNSTATQKRVDKYVKVIEEATKEIESLQEQLNKLASDIASVNAEEEQFRIEDLAKQDAEGYEESHRGYKAKELMERVNREIDVLTNNSGAGNPRNLINDTDFTNRGHGNVSPSNFQPYHQVEYPAHVEAWEKETKEVDAKLDADYAELLEAIEKYFGKKLF